jgi:hypothetical protein
MQFGSRQAHAADSNAVTDGIVMPRQVSAAHADTGIAGLLADRGDGSECLDDSCKHVASVIVGNAGRRLKCRR